MIHLKDKYPLVFNELARAKLSPFELVSLGEVYEGVLQGISLAGDLTSFTPVLDKNAQNTALIVIVTVDKKVDNIKSTYTYTFQFELEAGKTSRTITNSKILGVSLPKLQGVIIPTAKYSFTLLAERNMIAYYNNQVVGTLKDIIDGSSKIL